jgi:hypothetical protein
MKHYKVRSVQPTLNQLHPCLKGKLSNAGEQSPAYYAVYSLFESAEALYRTLDSHTSNSLAIFRDAGRYLTLQQEHDLMALTALYAAAINTQWLQRIVDQDSALTESDRAVLKSALELYKTTTEATCAALGVPTWLE